MDVLTQCIVGISLVLFGIYGFIAILIYSFEREDKLEAKRRNEIIEYFTSNGFKYNDISTIFPNDVRDFNIAHTDKKGYSVKNYIAETYGQRDGVDITIVDHTYLESIGRQRGCYEHTLCLLRNQEIKIPDFYLRNRIFILDSIKKLFGMKEIIISEDKEFSKKFVLQGQNEEEIRNFFNSSIRQVFILNQKRGCEYESKNNSLMVSKRKYFLFMTAGYLNVKERIELLENSLKLFNSFKHQ